MKWSLLAPSFLVTLILACILPIPVLDERPDDTVD